MEVFMYQQRCRVDQDVKLHGMKEDISETYLEYVQVDTMTNMFTRAILAC